MSGDKSSKCIANIAEKDLFKTDTKDLDEFQLEYNQNSTDKDILFYQRVL